MKFMNEFIVPSRIGVAVPGFRVCSAASFHCEANADQTHTFNDELRILQDTV